MGTTVEYHESVQRKRASRQFTKYFSVFRRVSVINTIPILIGQDLISEEDHHIRPIYNYANVVRSVRSDSMVIEK